ncbi:MAG: hypothetical protein AB4911_20750 [Oscillochloridaceae bacterium umkhey_bin13]
MGLHTARIVLWIGIVLTVIGLICRYILGIREITSLLPAIFGMPISLLGFIALEPHYARGAMRGVSGLSLLGIVATLYVIPELNALRLGQPFGGHLVVLFANAAMLVLCAALFGLSLWVMVRAWLIRRR